eukprot:422941-Prorocentrum_minimum.AAC.1
MMCDDVADPALLVQGPAGAGAPVRGLLGGHWDHRLFLRGQPRPRQVPAPVRGDRKALNLGVSAPL